MVLGNRFWGWSGIGRQCEARVPSGRGGVGRLLFRRRGRLGRGDKTVPDVPAGGDLFRLGSVPGSAWAHVSRQLRVDERDRIIAVATEVEREFGAVYEVGKQGSAKFFTARFRSCTLIMTRR